MTSTAEAAGQVEWAGSGCASCDFKGLAPEQVPNPTGGFLIFPNSLAASCLIPLAIGMQTGALSEHLSQFQGPFRRGERGGDKIVNSAWDIISEKKTGTDQAMSWRMQLQMEQRGKCEIDQRRERVHG